MNKVYFYANNKRVGLMGEILSGSPPGSEDGTLRIRATDPPAFAGRVFEVPSSEVRQFHFHRKAGAA